MGFAAMGCAADASTDESATDDPLGRSMEGLTGPTVYFQSYTYAQSNGGGAVERFADCRSDQILTGVGARVTSDNFTDLSIYCRDILSNGSLSSLETRFTVGGTSEEKALHAPSGYAVVGGGAIVTSDNVYRLVLRICPWIPSTKRIDVASCSYISTTSGSFSAETFLDTHTGVSSANTPRTVGTGLGFTSSGDNVIAVRMSSGLLK